MKYLAVILAFAIGVFVGYSERSITREVHYAGLQRNLMESIR